METRLPAPAQAALDTALPAVRARLLDPADTRPDALNVTTREKASAVLTVSVQVRPDADHAGSSTTATLELRPHTHAGEVVYQATEVEYSGADY